jgi:hypothetical protein
MIDQNASLFRPIHFGGTGKALQVRHAMKAIAP